jgi:hypothetical protein
LGDAWWCSLPYQVLLNGRDVVRHHFRLPESCWSRLRRICYTFSPSLAGEMEERIPLVFCFLSSFVTRPVSSVKNRSNSRSSLCVEMLVDLAPLSYSHQTQSELNSHYTAPSRNFQSWVKKSSSGREISCNVLPFYTCHGKWMWRLLRTTPNHHLPERERVRE